MTSHAIDRAIFPDCRLRSAGLHDRDISNIVTQVRFICDSGRHCEVLSVEDLVDHVITERDESVPAIGFYRRDEYILTFEMHSG